MTTMHVVSAPGKLVLVGEYAVLEGAPAISAAVNIFAVATLQSVAATTSELRIANCGSRYGFSVAPGGTIEWLADPADLGALLVAALEALAARGLLKQSLPPFSLELCSRNFFNNAKEGPAQKIGVGSSAAIVVALTSALQSYLGHDPAFEVCLDAHRRFQKGKGSGVDVATSWFGGVIAMQPKGGDAPLIEKLTWPQGLTVAPVWTGESASTTLMLQRLEQFKSQPGNNYQKIMQRLVEASQDTCKNWQTGAADDVIASLDEYGGILHELDSAAGIGIWSPCHQRLDSVARKAGVSYKPSGAGGGDFGLAFSRDAARLQDFLSEVNAKLIPQPDKLGWADRGLIINGAAISDETAGYSK